MLGATCGQLLLDLGTRNLLISTSLTTSRWKRWRTLHTLSNAVNGSKSALKNYIRLARLHNRSFVLSLPFSVALFILSPLFLASTMWNCCGAFENGNLCDSNMWATLLFCALVEDGAEHKEELQE